MKKHVLLFFLFITGALFTYAAPKIEKAAKPSWVIAPKDYGKKIPLKSVQEGYYYKLLDNQIHVETEADYNHVILEIVSKAGVQQASNISVNFRPDYQKLIFHEITVWRDGQAINKLKLNEIKVLQTESDLSSFLYHGTYYAHIILDDVRAGDRIEYSYTIKGRNPVFGGKYSENLFFDEFVPIAHLYKRLIADKGRKLQFKNFNNVPKVKTAADGQYQYHEWESFSVKVIESEERIPSWQSVYSRTEISEYNDWKEVVDWAIALNPVKEIEAGALGEKIKELKQKHRGYHKEGYIEEAIQFVQDEIRYMGIEMGVYSHKANLPEKVYNQRYGDCKDKSVLLASILKSGGINASLALVNSYRGRVITESLISPLLFDHVIVYINHKGRSYFIDPTISYQRGGLYRLYCPKYYKALVILPGQNKLTDIPQQPIELGKIKIEENFFMSPKPGVTRLQVRSVYSGNHADDMRYRFAYNGEENIEKEFLEYYRGIYTNVEMLDSLNFSDYEYDNTFVITENYEITDLWKSTGDNGEAYEFQFSAGMISNNFMQIGPHRKYPLALNHPYELEYNVYIHMWSPWSITKDNFKLKRGAYELKANASSKNNIIALEYYLKTFKDHISVAELEEYRKDIPDLDKNLGFKINYTGNGTPVQAKGLSLVWIIVVFGIITAGIFAGYKLYVKPSGFTVSSEEYLALQKTDLGWFIAFFMVVLFYTFWELTVFYNNYVFTLSYLQGVSFDNQSILLGFIKPIINIVNIILGILLMIFLVNRRVETPKYAHIWLLLNLVSIVVYWLSYELITDLVSSEFRIMMFFVLAIFIVSLYYFKTSESIKEVFAVPYPYPKYPLSHYKPVKRPKLIKREKDAV